MSGPVVLGLRLLLTISLYVFLVVIFIYLWRDVRQQAVLISTRKTPPIGLIISTGAEPDQVRHFNNPVVTIGRDSACECRLADPSISGRHARLSFHHNQWWLEDLGSTNGTILNQEKLTTPTVLVSSDIFLCGSSKFRVSISGEMIDAAGEGD
jgi:pSer/pThr/pTyr-binding forkhead associated (FHA) protein